MKPLELTEDHKKRLIEMCQVVLPKSNIEEINDLPYEEECYFIESEPGYSYKGEDYIDKIHWFEFCWVLLNKMMNEFSPIEGLNHINTFGLICFNQYESAHPVDYLYNLFNEINYEL